jgi:hypothetical protein
MSSADPPIIITGGSVTIEFDPGTFPANGNGRHSNANKKIKRVEITGDGINFAQDTPNGKVTIRVIYGNNNSQP